MVLSVRAGDAEKAYPLEALGDAVVNDTVGEAPVVVLARGPVPQGVAFSRRLEGRTLTFREDQGAVRDEETGSTWSFAGRASAGPLAGARLRPLPTRRAFWFALGFAVEDIPVYRPP